MLKNSAFIGLAEKLAVIYRLSSPCDLPLQALMSLSPAEQLAKYLLEIKAVKLSVDEPFTWTSGIQSPIYCDNRVVLSFPPVRDFVKSELANIFKENFTNADMMAWIATAGIAHGALAAQELNIPYCYVRPEPKKHGMKNQIEGFMPAGSKLVLIEDLISTGKSSLQAVNGVIKDCGEVLGVIALFTYCFESAKALFAQRGIALHTISNFEILGKVALESSYITAEQYEAIKKFMANPHSWQ